MAAAFNPHLEPLIRKLESIAPLEDDEKQALISLPVTVRNIKRDQDIVREQEQASHCCLIIDGLVYGYKIVSGGKRQIFSFYIPGDIPDLQSLHFEIMDRNLASLTASKVAFIPHEALRAFIRSHPRIGDIFWRETLIQAAIFREWMAGIGRRDACSRMAHLFCELFIRLGAVGLTDGNGYRMPITQAVLADALGLSTVHVNRSLQRLRRSGLIRTLNGRIHIENWNQLQETGDFEPTYLHLKKRT
jgi:CRP-like cAMP-binding protein